jgi:hypothetical protein|tara:strand:+ start:477 stop:989 length:513 start_codon:yes stop_codon:yes gene_type:complete
MAITKIQSESMNLADTYAFTGTVTGAGFAADEFFNYKPSSDQTLATSTWTKISLQTAIISNSNFDSSTNYRYTVPSGKAGKYHIGLSGNWLAAGDFNNCIVAIRKNGSGTLVSNIRQEHYENNSASKILSLSVGDYLELYGWQESGGNLDFRDSGSDQSSGFMYGYRIGE